MARTWVYHVADPCARCAHYTQATVYVIDAVLLPAAG
jgi:hypothetical protein